MARRGAGWCACPGYLLIGMSVPGIGFGGNLTCLLSQLGAMRGLTLTKENRCSTPQTLSPHPYVPRALLLSPFPSGVPLAPRGSAVLMSHEQGGELRAADPHQSSALNHHFVKSPVKYKLNGSSLAFSRVFYCVFGRGCFCFPRIKLILPRRAKDTGGEALLQAAPGRWGHGQRDPAGAGPAPPGVFAAQTSFLGCLSTLWQCYQL